MKNSEDNVFITWNLNAKYANYNCSKTDQRVLLKNSLNDADLFIADNDIATHRDSRTNTNDIIDYVISLPAIHDNTQSPSITQRCHNVVVGVVTTLWHGRK